MVIAWQNVAHNQLPYPSFYIGEDMKKAPELNILVKKPKLVSASK
jgi:hypothetical protein